MCDVANASTGTTEPLNGIIHAFNDNYTERPTPILSMLWQYEWLAALELRSTLQLCNNSPSLAINENALN